MRLIDADAFAEKIKEISIRQGYYDFYPESMSVGEILDSVIATLKGEGLGGFENAPTIDAVPAWIPVTERLPEHEYGESTSVLTVDLFGVMRVTYFDGGNWCWPSGEALTTMRVAPITHWMPLPEPPKGEREDDE